MSLKPRTWLFISLTCFLGATVFWELGRRETARQKQTVPATPPQAAPAPAAPPTALLSPAPSSLTFQAANTHAEPTNSPNPFRLRNSSASVGELARREDSLLLVNALVDGRHEPSLAIPESLRLKGPTSSYLIQSRDRIDDAFRALLSSAGATLVSYIPNNAFLVRLDPAAVSKLSNHPGIRSIIPWQPYFKLSADLLGHVMQSKPIPDDAHVRVLVYPGESDAAVDELKALGLPIVRQTRSPFGTQLVVGVTDSHLPLLAHLDRVQWIETAAKASVLNDLGNLRLGTSTNNGADTQYLGLTGEGVTVNVNDTGVDAAHPDLKVHSASGATVDVDGHGTHVAGIIASTGLNGPTVASNSVSGSATNAHFRGKAPKAEILAFPFDIYLGALVPEDEVRSILVSNKVHISNNSWGYPAVNNYDSVAASYDEAVRDAIPGTPGFQQLAFVFSAGNSGRGDDNGRGGAPGTVTSPATAKNVISVGALESLRRITNMVASTNNGVASTNRIFIGDTDSDNQVADYSSRGNVGAGVEGDFGRFKPDVVAPGSFIVSTRSSDWTDPAFIVQVDPSVLRDETVGPRSSIGYRAVGPPDTVRLAVRAIPNARSPKPFPKMIVTASLNAPPPPYTHIGTNYVRVDRAGLTNLYINIENPLDQEVSFDLVYYFGLTNRNARPGYFEALKELNSKLAPHYRYESGTSMAAPAISGMLALVQEFFVKNLSLPVPSPALFKALLINSARGVDSVYDRAVVSSPNDQGWGLPLLSRMLPQAMKDSPSDPNAWPVQFVEQDTNLSLTTGEELTWKMNVQPPAGSGPDPRSSPMTVTLVWTDPPGNPAASIKLVNDLDLIVTNITTGEIYWGNDIPGGSLENVFTGVGDTNRYGDVVNNVENVYIPGNLGDEYAITVRGHRVAVDSQPSHGTGAAQDFVLVVGLGNPRLKDAFRLTRPSSISSNIVIDVPTLGSEILPDGQQISSRFGEKAGANAPLNLSTNGELRQWRLFTFTNASPATFTNLLFAVMPSGNLSTPRLAEPDLDLYVSDDPRLLDLDPAVLETCRAAGQFSLDRRNGASRGRGATEFVTWGNSPATEKYYIAVKSEDQKAGEFDIVVIASDDPFEQENPDGSVTLNFVGLSLDGVPIPDGSNAQPGGIATLRPALFIGRTEKETMVKNVQFQIDFEHANFGDLTALITGPAPDALTATAFSHSLATPVVSSGRYRGLFDDNPNRRQIIPPGYVTAPSEGPIRLDFLGGRSGRGLWQFRLFDNSETATGRVFSASITIHPQDPDCESDSGPPPGCFFEACPGQPFLYWLNLPADVSAVDICIESNNIPAGIVLVKGRATRPDLGTWLHFEVAEAGGGCLRVDEFSSPPVEPGLYRLGIFTLSPTDCVSGILKIQVHRSFLADRTQTFVSTNVPLALINDALTSSVIPVDQDRRIVDARVGLRVDHSRVSDLAFHLVSPGGTRWLLTENRGITTAEGYGRTFAPVPVGAPPEQMLTNYSWAIFGDNEVLANSPIKFIAPPFRSAATGPNSVVYNANFELEALRVVRTGESVAGWSVLTNFAQVLRDSVVRGTNGNVLAISQALLENRFNLGDQRLYQLEFAYRRASSSTIQDITFPVQATTNLTYSTTDHLRGTIAPAVVVPKLRLSPGQQVHISVPPDALVQVAAGQFVSAMGGPVGAVFRDLPRNALVGQWAYSSSLLSTQTAWGLPFFVGTNAVIDVPSAPGDYFLWLAINDSDYRDNAGELPVTARWIQPQLAELEFVIGGVRHLLAPGDGWQTFRTRISGRPTALEATLRSSWNSTVLIDDFVITEPLTAAYYLAEESLPTTLRYDVGGIGQTSPSQAPQFEEKFSIKGENSRGDWRLEVTDSRSTPVAGAANLLGWFVQFVYGPQQRPLALTNCVDFGFRLRRSQIRYFEVNVPMEARQAVVQVVSRSPGHSFIFGFNPSQLPDLSTDQVADPLFLNVGPAGPASVPPGSKFFLAVQTDFSPDPHDLVIRVDFELPMTSLINGVPFVPAFGVNQAGVSNFFQMTPVLLNQTNILYPGTNIHWYKYTVAPSPTLHSVVFRLHSTNRELQMVTRRSLPEVAYLPTPTLFDYHSINYDLTNDVIIVTSNSFPVPITAIPWVIGVYNAGTNSGAYHLTATRWTNRPPVAIPLPAFTINTNWINITNEVGFSIDPGESLNTFYRFQSGATNRTVLFELLSLTGDADLRVRRNDLPSPSLFDLSDFQIGTNSEHVAVNTNVFLPTFGAPTNWYLNVLNSSSTTVTGILRVATASGTNIIISGLPLELEPVGIAASGGLIITWRSIPGQVYEVRTSNNALGPFNTLAATVLATSSISQWTDPNPPIPPQTRFYKVFQIGPP